MAKELIEDEEDAYHIACKLQQLLSAERDIPFKTVRRYAYALARWAAQEALKEQERRLKEAIQRAAEDRS